jgi:hypothetical protein
MHGILRSVAPLAADYALLSFATGLALIAGAILARRQRYRAHAWCQSAVQQAADAHRELDKHCLGKLALRPQ